MNGDLQSTTEHSRVKPLTSRATNTYLIVLVVLTLLTWIVGSFEFHFQTEYKFSFGNDFPGEHNLWETHGDPQNVLINDNGIRVQRLSPKSSYAMRIFEIPPPVLYNDYKVRVTGTVTTIKTASPNTQKNIAALMIWFLDQNQQVVQYNTIEPLNANDAVIYEAERVVRVPENSRFLSLVLINRVSDGTFDLLDAEIHAVKTTNTYKIALATLLLLWSILLSTTIFWIARRSSPKSSVVIGFLLLTTLVGVLMPETVTDEDVLRLSEILTIAIPFVQIESLTLIYKFGHFTFFFLVTLCLMTQRHALNLSSFTIMKLMLVFAVATEGMQLYLFDRSTRTTDIAIDASGILIAFLITIAIHTKKA